MVLTSRGGGVLLTFPQRRTSLPCQAGLMLTRVMSPQCSKRLTTKGQCLRALWHRKLYVSTTKSEPNNAIPKRSRGGHLVPAGVLRCSQGSEASRTLAPAFQLGAVPDSFILKGRAQRVLKLFAQPSMRAK